VAWANEFALANPKNATCGTGVLALAADAGELATSGRSIVQLAAIDTAPMSNDLLLNFIEIPLH
jgi:hypothetical protein